jgi:predicted ABC-type ATPase
MSRDRAASFYINVDRVAAGFSPFHPDRTALRAGRLALQEIQHRIRDGSSFAYETTLAGRQYSKLIPLWRKAGYRVKLIFLSLPNADLAIARVSARVAQGGHGVFEHVIRRRYDARLRNFHDTFCKLVDV